MIMTFLALAKNKSVEENDRKLILTVSGYSPPCSIVSKRSPDPFMLGSWGRFSGVISTNLWVSFIGVSLQFPR